MADNGRIRARGRALNLWSPKGDCHLALTSGHTFIVPGEKNGVEVPQRFRREALAHGCVPVDTTPEDADTDTFSRAATIRGAVKRAVANARPPNGPMGRSAAPHATAIESEAPADPAPTATAAAADHAVNANLDDPVVQKIARALQDAGDAGLTRSAVRDLLNRNVQANRVAAALELLRINGLARCETVRTGGRPSELWKIAK